MKLKNKYIQLQKDLKNELSRLESTYQTSDLSHEIMITLYKANKKKVTKPS